MKLSRCRIFPASVAIAAVVAVAGPSRAADVSQNRVQLQVFQVKVIEVQGRQGQMPVAVYIYVPNRKASKDVCAVAPRVRDALNTHLRKETYKLDAKGNLQDLPAMSAAARPVVENAAKKENVSGIEIKQGPPQVKSSAASMFQKSGCIGVADAVEEPKAAKGAPKAAAH